MPTSRAQSLGALNDLRGGWKGEFFEVPYRRSRCDQGGCIGTDIVHDLILLPFFEKGGAYYAGPIPGWRMP